MPVSEGILPIFPVESTPINNLVSVMKKDGRVYYFNGCMPIFTHGEEDLGSFRMFTSQLYVNGICKQRQIAEAFGISLISVKRSVKKYLEKGPGVFF